MSCYPKELKDDGDPDLIKAAKLLRYAKFAVRFQSQSMPNLNEKPKKKKSKKVVPSYMRPSKATLRREAEIQKNRVNIIQKAEERKEDDERRRADKIAALEAELARLKEVESKMPTLESEMKEMCIGNDQIKLVSSEKNMEEGGQSQLQAFMPAIGGSPSSVEKPLLQLNLDKVLGREAGEIDAEGNTDKEELTPPYRTGDKRSFQFQRDCVNISKLSAKRCFRVLTYRDLPNGKREVTDIPNGSVYYCKTGPQLRRITPYGVAFDSKDGALSERFPANQVGAAASGNGTTPRILVSFDCWGRTHRRLGGAGAAKYQYCKFIKIVDFLDASKTVSKKNVEHPVKPHFWPKADRRKPPRSPIDRAIYLDKCFNVRTWDPPEDPRPYTPEFQYDHYKPMVPSHKVRLGRK